MFNSAFPIITTPDVARALTFYRDALGGTVTYQFPPDAAAVFVTVAIGRSEIGLAHDPASSAPCPRFAMWIYADDCDAAVARLRDGGVTIVEEPIDQPWGERVARVRDPDENLVFIGSHVRT